MLERLNQRIDENFALQECRFPNWYAKFRKISIRSNCLLIPDPVVQYLQDELLILPKECGQNYEGYDDEDCDDASTPEPSFPEFSAEIAAAIAELGGAAFVKTNWRSPKDAYWITAGQTMRVKDILDVYQLLKASSICKDDLTKEMELISMSDTAGIKHFLVLKKWYDIHPGTEFRCFVRNRQLVGISPRDWPQFHDHILSQKRDIVNDIRTVFREQIKDKFPLTDYIFDVVRKCKDEVILIDFAPFNPNWTEPLAFEWTELDILETDNNDDPEFRYLSTECGIQPTKRNNYGIPKDVVDMFTGQSAVHSGNGSFDDFLHNQLQEQCNIDE